MLEQYPHEASVCAKALLALGRPQEVLKKYRRNWFAVQEVLQARYLLVLKKVIRNGFTPAAINELMLLRKKHFDYRCDSYLFAHFMLTPALQALSNERPAALVTSCRKLMGSHEFCFGRKLWYLAGYICGKVTRAQFLKQPCRRTVRAYLHVAEGMRFEMGSDRRRAYSEYRKYLQIPRHKRDLDFVLDAFIDWRARECASA